MAIKAISLQIWTAITTVKLVSVAYAGEPLTLTYRVVVSDRALDRSDGKALYKEYIAERN